MKLEIEITEDEIRSAVERKIRVAVADQSNQFGADEYIKKQVKAQWQTAVDAMILEALNNSQALRDMAQITEDLALDALKRCQQGQHPPLTAWETQQLIYAWLERERMRRALHEIAEEWAGAECGEPVHAQEAYAIGLAKRMYALAVEGLTPNARLTGPQQHEANDD